MYSAHITTVFIDDFIILEDYVIMRLSRIKISLKKF